jgi:hypothetical protein
LIIRTVHHQAATGGTLISKCIAALANVSLLSEINPLGSSSLKFSPVDLFSQYQAQYGVRYESIKKRYFLAQLELVLECCKSEASKLVIRDHNHTAYMWANTQNRMPLLEFLSDYERKSIVTIRNPIDSYLSCLKNNWLKHINNDFNLYCQRYLLFLENYNNLPIIKYEDFCKSPSVIMKQICDILELDFDENFINNFSDIKLTGDSGRRFDKIVVQDRRVIPDEIMSKIEQSRNYREFCELYSYKLTGSGNASI